MPYSYFPIFPKSDLPRFLPPHIQLCGSVGHAVLTLGSCLPLYNVA